jgi:raffinose/stachyose/melibiose transport system permease protein
MRRRKIVGWGVGVVAVVASVVVFLVPFAFIFLTAAKSAPEAAAFDFSLPTEW